MQAKFIDVARERYFLQVTPLRDAMGIDWLIVVVIPESDFIKQINANTRNTILLCLVALVVAIAIAIDKVDPFLSTYPITRPLYIYAETKAIRQRSEVQGFVNYYLTYVNAQISTVGYLPVKPPVLNESKIKCLQVK